MLASASALLHLGAVPLVWSRVQWALDDGNAAALPHAQERSDPAMTEGTPQRPFAALHQALHSGEMTRREFTLRALALGVGMPIISFILRAETARALPGRHIGWGVAAQGTAGPPAEGMEGRTRGEGGELKLI